MILLDVPPPPFFDPVSDVMGISFFFILAAAAVFSFIKFKSKANTKFWLVIAGIFLGIAVIGGLIISVIIPQVTYTNPYAGNRSNNRAK